MSTPCTHCTTGVDHCHGTLVVHATGPADCTQPDCTDTDEARHDLRIDCGSVMGGCDCARLAQVAAA